MTISNLLVRIHNECRSVSKLFLPEYDEKRPFKSAIFADPCYGPLWILVTAAVTTDCFVSESAVNSTLFLCQLLYLQKSYADCHLLLVIE